ncbi:MAG: sulfotransferase domain-containing protein [Magnetococcales bacterium]|nr:sulfotransferase domain-containing protein [Magnetococcales bacterium]
MTGQPIIFLSVFKSGTHLVRRILEDMTGLPFFEPPIVAGKVNYQDAGQLIHKKGHFYSWHLFPTPEVCQKLVEMKAKPIFLLRNIYDLPVSMYYHFANNIDVEIGRGRNVDAYFRAMSREEGLSAIISGMERVDFRWRGTGPHYQQMALMLEFANQYPCFVTSFERINTQKAEEVVRLGDFLELPLSQERVTTILHNSGFQVMKETSLSGSHFRKGQAGSHADELNQEHVVLIQQQLATHAPQLAQLVAQAQLPEILARHGQL